MPIQSKKRESSAKDSTPHSDLSIRKIATELFPNLPKLKGEINLDLFLVWPPDLFALTSRILSNTGLYYYVVSPPDDREWPPEKDFFEMNGASKLWKDHIEQKKSNDWKSNAKEEWKDYVRFMGLKWREKIYIKKPSFDYNKLQNLIREADSIEKVNELTAVFTPDDLLKFAGKYISKILDTDLEELIHYDPQKDESRVVWNGYQCLMSLHAIADEASDGWGIRNISWKNEDNSELDYTAIPPDNSRDEAQKHAEKMLEIHGTMSHVDSLRCRVLPKRHTPNVGIALRSVSANLAYHRSSVDVKWTSIHENNANTLLSKMTKVNKPNHKKTLNILLLPWPLKLYDKDFMLMPNKKLKMDDGRYGFFTYSPEYDYQDSRGNVSFQSMLNATLDGLYSEFNYLEEDDGVDLVILPEGSLLRDNVEVLKTTLAEWAVPGFITGLRQKDQKGKKNKKDKKDLKNKSAEKSLHFEDNMVMFQMGRINDDEQLEFQDSKIKEGSFREIYQYKHHRWKLNRNQIIKYNLEGILDPELDWWEAINIKKRQVNFINIGEQLTVCPLICEDLARQDPIADLIRTVGPSLVVTILMDGPQTPDRWSAKYASILAEDPGSAVLTLTSFGMVEKAQSVDNLISRQIALWSDGRGLTKAIPLQPKATGVLLKIGIEPVDEVLADGRCENNNTNSLTFKSAHQIMPLFKRKE